LENNDTNVREGRTGPKPILSALFPHFPEQICGSLVLSDRFGSVEIATICGSRFFRGKVGIKVCNLLFWKSGAESSEKFVCKLARMF
jgi:hypothetical protein